MITSLFRKIVFVIIINDKLIVLFKMLQLGHFHITFSLPF